jgi:hypothetical protein
MWRVRHIVHVPPFLSGERGCFKKATGRFLNEVIDFARAFQIALPGILRCFAIIPDCVWACVDFDGIK